MIKNKKIDIIGVCSDKGASRLGSDKGPQFIRLAGLSAGLTALGYDVCDCGDICLEKTNTSAGFAAECASTKNGASKQKLNNLAEVTEINNRLGGKVCECLKNGGFPLVLGGDHSITAGSAYAALKHYGKIGIIWADAHGDFNNAESSPSGNIHGMPLSALCGFGPDEILPLSENEGIASFINPKNAVVFGARDLDETEKTCLKNAGVTVITPEEIDKNGIATCVLKAIETASAGTNGIYFSFDLDCLDLSAAPGVGTPAEGGLTFREARFLCEEVFKSGRLIAADMAELNPMLDKEDRTASVAAQLVSFMLGKKLY